MVAGHAGATGVCWILYGSKRGVTKCSIERGWCACTDAGNRGGAPVVTRDCIGCAGVLSSSSDSARHAFDPHRREHVHHVTVHEG